MRLACKSIELLFKTSKFHAIFRHVQCLAALLFLSLSAFPQGSPDSLSTPYDSLQDLRDLQFRRSIERQLREIEQQSLESGLVRDSLADVVDALRQQAGHLARENQRLEAEIDAVRQGMDRSTGESIRYRKKLEGTLWVAGSILVILMAASFVFLLLFTLRTRWMLEKLKGRVVRLRRNLKEQRKKMRRAPGMDKKAIRSITRSEVRSRIKAKHLKKK